MHYPLCTRLEVLTRSLEIIVRCWRSRCITDTNCWDADKTLTPNTTCARLRVHAQRRIRSIFTARRYASAVCAMMLSLCKYDLSATNRCSIKVTKLIITQTTNNASWWPTDCSFLTPKIPVKFRWVITPFKVIQGHRFWYQSKAHIRLPISG